MTETATQRLDATATLLWESCRRRVDASAVAGALDDGADLAMAVDAARSNRMVGLLVRALSEAGRLPDDGPAAVARNVAELQRLQGQVLVAHALELAVTPLRSSGLEPVVLKGPAVAVRYPDPGLRSMEDIDLLLPRADHQRAVALLERAGWRIVRRSGHDRYDTILSHPEAANLALELHYGLEAFFERHTSLDSKLLWARRVPLDCLGTAAFGLPLEEELVYLCTHAAKPFHSFSRLIWIADLAMVVGHAEERDGAPDWEKIADLSRQARCHTGVSTAMAMARRIGVDAPQALFPLPPEPWRRVVIQPLLQASWPILHPVLPAFRLRFALADSWWLRTGLLFGGAHDVPVRDRVRWAGQVTAQLARRWLQVRRDAAEFSGNAS
ncbi:MAG: nucleotidyltransferase family protein [Acidimicrobiales bacterium]